MSESAEKGWFGFPSVGMSNLLTANTWKTIGACAIMVAAVFAIVATVLVLIPTFKGGVFHCSFGKDLFKESLDASAPSPSPSRERERPAAEEAALVRAEEFLQFKSGLEGTAYGNCHAFCAKASCFLLEASHSVGGGSSHAVGREDGECIKGKDGQNPKCASHAACLQECDGCAVGSLPSFLSDKSGSCLSSKDCKKFGFARVADQ